MLPLPIISNTSKFVPPQNDLQMLKDEVLLGNYAEIKYTTNGSVPTQPYTVSNVMTFMYGKGGTENFALGSMWGSSFTSKFTQDSTYFRAYQHAFPTQAIYDYYVNNPTTPAIMQRTAIEPGSTFLGLNRNGYTSIAYGATNYPSVYAIKFVYYDPSVDAVFWYNPSTNSPPQRYYS